MYYFQAFPLTLSTGVVSKKTQFYKNGICKNGYTSCSRNCRSRIYCKNGYEFEIQCPKEAPWCDTNSLECTKVSGTCAAEGQICSNNQLYYPDLLDCENFYYCSGGMAIKYRWVYFSYAPICHETHNFLVINWSTLALQSYFHLLLIRFQNNIRPFSLGAPKEYLIQTKKNV